MRTALVTGANRGIGLEFARQLKENGYQVIGCCRNTSEAYTLKKLADEVFQLDVTLDTDIDKLKKNLGDRAIDFLVNNAGISGEQGVTIGQVDRQNFMQVLNVNCVSVIKLSDALLANVQKSDEKNILVISSQMGSISDNKQGRSYAYRASKAALNCVMRSFAIDVQSKGVHVMLIHPGWVKSDMGGANALIDIPSSVRSMLTQAAKYLPTSHAEVLHRFDGNTVGW